MVVLSVLQRILQSDSLGLLSLSFGNVSGKREDLEIRIGQDDVAALSGECCVSLMFEEATPRTLTAKNSRNSRYWPSLN
jgi:hypothetical protein